MQSRAKRSQPPGWSLLPVYVAGVGLLALSLSGCDTTPVNAAKKVSSEYGKDGRLSRLTYDRDGDGKIDTWGYMDGSRVVRVEVDENGDGKVDRWEYHKDLAGAKGSTGSVGSMGSVGSVGAAVDVTLERIEKATKFDGQISRREFFNNGVLARTEEDTDGDGKIDKWETYADGTLTVMALDTKGRGTPDRRLIYAPDGSLTRIEADPNGTGTFRPLPQ